MGDYTRVTLEAYPGGRLSISSLDADGYGGGYRICGPKFIDAIVTARLFGHDAPLEPTIVHELDARDVDAIRGHLRDADRIHGPDDPEELHALTEALDRYRRALRVPAPARDLPHQVANREAQRGALVAACEAALSVLSAEVQ